MASGLPNADKAETRKAYAAGEVGREELLASEVASYHSPGTCTFYGTANSNQMLMDVMGLHLPGAAFVHPDDPLRDALTDGRPPAGSPRSPPSDSALRHRSRRRREGPSSTASSRCSPPAARPTTPCTSSRWPPPPACTSRGRTSTTCRASSRSLARIYPNGPADVNHFHAAGGTPFLVGTLLDAGLLHEDVLTLAGPGLRRYTADAGSGRRAVGSSLVDAEPSPATPPCCARWPTAFAPDGGLRMLSGTLGNAVIKVSSVADEHRVIEAPARVFTDQVGFLTAFSRRELDRDVVVVIRDQGPSAPTGCPSCTP